MLRERHLARQLETTEAALEKITNERRMLAAKVLTTQEEERRQIGRELHDDITQGLAKIEIELQTVLRRWTLPLRLRETINLLTRQCSDLSDQAQNLSHRLHPAILADLGLQTALRNLVEDFKRTHGLSVHLVMLPIPWNLPLPIATTFYRVAQEALRNVVKHAPGALVTITLSASSNAVCLEVRDDGPGFDSTASWAEHGLGLISMRERVQLIEGEFEVRSASGAGTAILASVPWINNYIVEG